MPNQSVLIHQEVTIIANLLNALADRTTPTPTPTTWAEIAGMTSTLLMTVISV